MVHVYGVHACLLSHVLAFITIELAAIPTPFAELWRGFLLTLVYEAIMSVMIYGRLVALPCQRKYGNAADPYAVAIKRSRVIGRQQQ